MKKNGDNIFEKIYKFLSSFLVGCDTVVVISIHVMSKKCQTGIPVFTDKHS